MAKKRADRLKDMDMPKKPMGAEEAEMDLAMELGEEEPMLEEDEMMPEGPEEMDMESPLADFSDDELMQEMQMRGLMPEGEEGEEEMPEDDMMMAEEEEPEEDLEV